MGCAPAPRAPGCGNANVDFAMGIEGTQIAKDAASIILLDDNHLHCRCGQMEEERVRFRTKVWASCSKRLPGAYPIGSSSQQPDLWHQSAGVSEQLPWTCFIESSLLQPDL